MTDVLPTTLPPGWTQLSATQVDTYDNCKRKWAWVKIAGYKQEQHPSAVLGEETHQQLELYFRGVPLDLTRKSGEVAMAGLHLLPSPGTHGLVVEGEFQLTWAEQRVVWLGYKDLEYPDPHPPWCLVVLDHKTTGDLKWAKTPEELPTNIQAVLYAVDAMYKSGQPFAQLRWIYYQTKKPFKAKEVTTYVSADQIAPTFDRIKALSLEMAYHKANQTHPLSLPPSPGHCEAYGGCPFKSLCNLTDQERLGAIMSQGSFFNPPPGGGSPPVPSGISNAAAEFLSNLPKPPAEAPAVAAPSNGAGPPPWATQGPPPGAQPPWAPQQPQAPAPAPAAPPQWQPPAQPPQQPPAPQAPPQWQPPAPATAAPQTPQAAPGFMQPPAGIQVSPDGRQFLNGQGQWQDLPALAQGGPPAPPQEPKRGPGRPPGTGAKAASNGPSPEVWERIATALERLANKYG